MNKEPPDKPFMCAIKNTLKNMFIKNINKEYIDTINNAVLRTSKIVFHTYNFLNLYFMHLYNNKLTFPIINDSFITYIMLVVTDRKDKRGRTSSEKAQSIIDTLIDFYDDYYRHIMTNKDLVYDDKLKQILLYEATDIVTNINVNISEHYIQHVRKYVNVSFNVKDKVNDIKYNKDLEDNDKKEQIRSIYNTYSKIKDDILNPADITKIELTSDKKFHKWIFENKPFITPCKEKYEKNSMYYDVKVSPQHYLRCMFNLNMRMDNLNKKNMNHIYNKFIDRYNEFIKIDNMHRKDEDKQPFLKHIPSIKLFHVLPLRTSIVPKNITLDNFSLVNLLMETNKSEYFKNIGKNADKIWSKIFNLKDRIFKKKGYKFHHMIKTDGVSCSILFIKLDQNGQPCRRPKKIKKNLVENDEFKYIEEVPITQSMKNKLVVAIDPNHGNLISCVAKISDEKFEKKAILSKDANGKITRIKNRNYKTFRYTRSQRNIETKSKKYKMIREDLKKNDKIGNKNITEIESELSVHDSKTCDFEKFTSYLKKKIGTNRILYGHYLKPIHRKLKMNTYINTQKSESKMIKNFSSKFGSPKNALIVFGDYDKKDTMKGSEPHISKRIRKIFKRHGYETYKINEYCTSKLCNRCHHELERFKYVKGKDGKDHLLWGLLRCKNGNCNQIFVHPIIISADS